MKKIILVFISVITLTAIYNCKGSKNTVSSSENRTLVAAQTRWPDATMQSVNAGHEIYSTRCTKCHSEKNIPDYTEEAWGPILNNMAKKAKLTDEEKETVKRYILATVDVAKAKGK